ncbi:response regulator [Lentibacillus saliphilus]|uniref:response regulator n=1 Tax=Lentibacillus saliphilus TaxID=2737028 RepID=UPI001C2FBCD5|nr:response regulator [Lentibacillus saliphilus]
MMKAILVDDEHLALEFLERQINKISDMTVEGTFTYFDVEAQTHLLMEIDTVFLDIDMPEVNGLELAEQILNKNPNIMIVFVTAYNEYAVQAFELNALDYLMKPVQLDRLTQTVKRLEANHKADGNNPPSNHDQLQVNVFGELTITTANRTPETLQWRTSKAEELFLYLLHHVGQPVRKSELIELLWPTDEPAKAFSQLYTAIYHVRKTLLVYKDHLKVENKGEGYVLQTHNVTLDITEWAQRITSTQELNLDTVFTYESIMALYTAPYLDKYGYVWAESERYRLEQLWLSYAYKIADCYYKHDCMEEAQTWYIKICNVRPEEERAAFTLMRVYANHGYPMLVYHHYNDLKRALEDIGISMNSEIANWYSRWKNRQ